jgi:shikimate 5-dehydrogenase
MLIAQAEQQFSFWTGTTAPPDVMERAAVEFLRQRNT